MTTIYRLVHCDENIGDMPWIFSNPELANMALAAFDSSGYTVEEDNTDPFDLMLRLGLKHYTVSLDRNGRRSYFPCGSQPEAVLACMLGADSEWLCQGSHQVLEVNIWATSAEEALEKAQAIRLEYIEAGKWPEEVQK